MKSLREFIIELQELRGGGRDDAGGASKIPVVTPDEDGPLFKMSAFGLDFTAVTLPSEVLTEGRVSRMNAFWDAMSDRETLVVAVSAAEE